MLSNLLYEMNKNLMLDKTIVFYIREYFSLRK